MKLRSVALTIFTIVSIACLATQVHAGNLLSSGKGEETDKTSEPAVVDCDYEEIISDIKVYDVETNHLLWSASNGTSKTGAGLRWKSIYANISANGAKPPLEKEQCYKVTYNNVFKKQLECGLYKVTETYGFIGFWARPPAPLPIVTQ